MIQIQRQITIKKIISVFIAVILISSVSIPIFGYAKPALAQSLLSNITVGSNPNGVAFSSSNNDIYVANTGSNTVSVIGSNNNVIATVNVGSSPDDVAYDPANQDVYVSNSGSNNVSVIRTSDNSVVATIPANACTCYFAYDPQNQDMYAASAGNSPGSSNTVYAISASNTVVATITVDPNPIRIAFDPANGEIFVADYSSGEVTMIDGGSNSVIKKISIGANPNTVGYDPANGDMYVTENNSNQVAVINSSNNLVAMLTVGGNPYGVFFDPANNDIYVSNTIGDSVSAISPANSMTTISVGSFSLPSPYQITFDPADGDMYVSDSGGSGISVISSTNTVADTLTVENNPNYSVFDPSNNDIYVSNSGSGTVSVISSGTGGGSSGNTGSCGTATSPTLDNYSIAGAESLSLDSGSCQYFFVGSTAGGYQMSNISWSPDLDVVASYSNNLGISIGHQTGNTGSYYSQAGNHGIAGVGVSGFGSYSVTTASNPSGDTLSKSFTVSSNDLVLILVGGEGDGNLTVSGITAQKLENATYSEAGSNVIASEAIYEAQLTPGTYNIGISSITYPTNSGTSLGIAIYDFSGSGGSSSGSSSLSDNFASDSSLNSNLWQVNGPVGSKVGPAVCGGCSMTTPQISFSSVGMDVTGMDSTYQVATIESKSSFSLPFTAEAHVTGTVSDGNTFFFAVSTSDASNGIAILGNLNPGNGGYYGINVDTGTGTAGNTWNGQAKLYGSPQVNTPYDVLISVNTSGQATVSVSSNGQVLGQASYQVGTGPFFVVMGQGEGLPYTVGTNNAVWQSASLTSNSSSGGTTGGTSSGGTTSGPSNCATTNSPKVDSSSTAPAESLTMNAGSCEYFFVGSTAGGDPMNSISWNPDLNVIASYSNNLAISIGHQTGITGSFYSQAGNHGIAGVGVSGFGSYTSFTASTSSSDSLSTSFTVNSNDLVLVLVGGEGDGDLSLTGINAQTLQDATYSEAGSNVIASEAVYEAQLPAGTYNINISSITYPTNSGTSLGVVVYDFHSGSGGVVSSASTLTLTTNTTKVALGAQSDSGIVAALTATALDTSGNPVPNVQISFTSSRGTISSSTATTDNQGRATVYFTAVSTTSPGISNIFASTPTLSATTNVTIEPTSIFIPIDYSGKQYYVYFFVNGQDYSTISSENSNSALTYFEPANYLNAYVHNPSQNPLYGIAIYNKTNSGVQVQPSTTAVDIVYKTLVWATQYTGANFLNLQYGPNSPNYQSVYNSYQSEWKQEVGIAGSDFLNLATLIGPVQDLLNSALGSTDAIQAGDFTKLVFEAVKGYQSLSELLGPSTATKVLNVLEEYKLVTGNDYTGTQLMYNLSNMSPTQLQQFSEDLYSAAYQGSQLNNSNFAVDFLQNLGPKVIQIGLQASRQSLITFGSAYFGDQLTLQTAGGAATTTFVDTASGAATDVIKYNLPLAAAGAIQESYISPMASMDQEEVEIQNTLVQTMYPSIFIDLTDFIEPSTNLANVTAGVSVIDTIGLVDNLDAQWSVIDANMTSKEYLYNLFFSSSAQSQISSDNFNAVAYSQASYQLYQSLQGIEQQASSLVNNLDPAGVDLSSEMSLPKLTYPLWEQFPSSNVLEFYLNSTSNAEMNFSNYGISISHNTLSSTYPYVFYVPVNNTLAILTFGSPNATYNIVSSNDTGLSMYSVSSSGRTLILNDTLSSGQTQGYGITSSGKNNIIIVKGTPDRQPNSNGWYNSPVTISFSGFSSSTQPLSCTSPITYAGPDGKSVTITGHCTDNNGDMGSGNVTINYDSTPPEAYIELDPALKNVVLYGNDNLSGIPNNPISPSSVSPVRSDNETNQTIIIGEKGRDDNDKNRMENSTVNDIMHGKDNGETRTYTISDRAGNTLVLIEKIRINGNELKSSIISLQYDDEKVIKVPPNEEKFEWSADRNGTLQGVNQHVQIGKGKERQDVDAKYSLKNNTTTIEIKGMPGHKGRFTEPGLVLLHTATSQGNLLVNGY